MSRFILHLSDLHLGPRERDEEVGDFRKVNVLGATEKWVKTDVIRHNLAELARRLRNDGDQIEALVISGDITQRNRLDGFAMLDDVLAELGDRRPLPARTIVVPGNHDVMWQQSPFSPEEPEQRYAHFLKYVRDHGFVTPLLRGIDYSEGGVLLKKARPFIEAEDGRWLIVAVNSSNFCGRAVRLGDDQRHAWERAAAALGVSTRDLPTQLGLHASFDIARVDPQELTLLSRILSEHAECAGQEPHTRILVLHHHLQPVGEEEFKQFESLSNLRNVRDFLREHQFDVVLHGHKHTSALFYDHIYARDGVLGSRPRRVLVVASPAPAVAEGQPLCRLLRIDDEPRSGAIGVTNVPAAFSGGVVTLPNEVPLQLWRHDAPGPPLPPPIIEGPDLDTTYARIQGLFDGLSHSAHVHGLICRTDPPESGVGWRVPRRFPQIPGVASIDAWFAEMVRWWQRPASRLDEPGYFTHGSRIRRYGPAQVNQLDQAVEALRSDPKSTRAVITLLTPGPEPAAPGGFPSFCQLHLVIREHMGIPKLEALAYFRKQEMRFWWAINMAEILEVQREVLPRLVSDRVPGLCLGPITTISAVALRTDTAPRVHVPLVDRLMDEDPHLLSRMAAALHWNGIPGRSEMALQWEEVLAGLVPPERWVEDGVPIATTGLSYLIAALEPLTAAASSSTEADVLALLRQIHTENFRYETIDNKEAAHSQWYAQVSDLVDQVTLRVAQLFAKEEPTT